MEFLGKGSVFRCRWACRARQVIWERHSFFQPILVCGDFYGFLRLHIGLVFGGPERPVFTAGYFVK